MITRESYFEEYRKKNPETFNMGVLGNQSDKSWHQLEDKIERTRWARSIYKAMKETAEKRNESLSQIITGTDLNQGNFYNIPKARSISRRYIEFIEAYLIEVYGEEQLKKSKKEFFFNEFDELTKPKTHPFRWGPDTPQMFKLERNIQIDPVAISLEHRDAYRASRAPTGALLYFLWDQTIALMNKNESFEIVLHKPRRQIKELRKRAERLGVQVLIIPSHVSHSGNYRVYPIKINKAQQRDARFQLHILDENEIRERKKVNFNVDSLPVKMYAEDKNYTQIIKELEELSDERDKDNA